MKCKGAGGDQKVSTKFPEVKFCIRKMLYLVAGYCVGVLPGKDYRDIFKEG